MFLLETGGLVLGFVYINVFPPPSIPLSSGGGHDAGVLSVLWWVWRNSLLLYNRDPHYRLIMRGREKRRMLQDLWELGYSRILIVLLARILTYMYVRMRTRKIQAGSPRSTL